MNYYLNIITKSTIQFDNLALEQGLVTPFDCYYNKFVIL